MDPNPQDVQAKQQAHFEKARKALLKFLNEKGGTLPLADLHDYSLNRYFVQHQAFSRLMETLVDEKLVDYDFAKVEATITPTGKTFAAS